MKNRRMIKVGTRLRFVARPEYYLSYVFAIGKLYEVLEISLYGENRIPAFKFKGVESDWITERFFEEE